MISVTTSAKDVLQNVLIDATQRADIHDEQVGLRIAPTSDGGQPQLALVLDKPKEGDQIIEHNGKNVLMIGEPISAQLDGATVDAVDTPEGKQLTFTPKP